MTPPILTSEQARILRAIRDGRLAENEHGRYVILGDGPRPDRRDREKCHGRGYFERARMGDEVSFELTAKGEAALAAFEVGEVAKAVQRARRARFRATVRLFLDGVADRGDDDAPLGRYAQVWKGSLTVCVTDTETAEDRMTDTYDEDGSGEFKWLGTIDLDTGDLVASSGETALGLGLALKEGEANG